MKKLTSILVLMMLVFCSVFAMGGAEEKKAPAAEVSALQWWDHFLPLAPLHQKLWEQYAAATGIRVNYTQYDPAKQNDALLLAFRSGQSPDVFSYTFPQTALTSLFNEGWFSPLAVEVKDLPDHVRNALFEGKTLKNGKVYSFPIMNNLNHNVPVWYFKDTLASAGYASAPKTFAEMREAAKKITQNSGGKTYGVVLPVAFTQRMNESIDDWVNASGGSGPIDWKTGEYQFASQPYVDVFEFLTGLKDDGSVHPASVNMDMRAARERWAAGEAAVLFDGCWNIGVLKTNFPQVVNAVGVAEPVRKSASDAYKVYRFPPTGTFYVSAQSKAVKQATEVLLMLTRDDYYIELANRMDQPPLKLDAVQKASVLPAYTQIIDIFEKTMAYQPDPTLKNPAVGDVYGEMKDIHPNPAEILQGYYSGAISDWKAELVKYTAAMTKERNRAIKVVQDKGKKVSLDDWKFSNWTYGTNFSTDKY